MVAGGEASGGSGIEISGQDAASCLIAFGGIANGLGMPPFEFFRIVDGLPALHVFVRDLDQEWYQRGIRDVGDGIASTTAALRDEFDRRGVERITCIGNSAGGFAAMLFGSLLGAHAIHAFAPQTNMTRAFRLRHGDRRWRPQVRAMRRNLPAENVLDVRETVRRAAVPVDLYFSTDSRLDSHHARHVADLPNVTCHTFGAGGHGLIRDMRDSGRLREILEACLS